MSKVTNIGSRIHSVERGNVVAGANEILDDAKGKKQNVINSEVEAELLRLDQSKQNNLTFDNTPTENSTNPVKSSGVYAADKALSDAIEAILILIPSAASALNQLADKAFVNSSIATDTATFRGTSDTGLSEAQFLEWANGLTHDMNDYVFWQTIDEAGNTLFKRYKWNGTQWLYEYTLNNSSFTADQWAAITSGITTALVEKLVGLPTNAALQQALNGKQDTLTFDNVPTENSTNPVKSGGVYSAVKAEEDARLNLAQTVSEIGGDVSQIENVIPAGATAQNKLVSNASMEAYVASIINNITASFTLATADGHINLTLTQVNGQVATLTLTSSDIASAQALTALTGRVTTAEGNITSLTGRVSTNETDIANLQQLYNNLQQSKPVPVTSLPTTGQQQGVIYRLAGTTSYSDNMWNGSTWVLMATYDNAIDDEPTAGSNNLVKSGGVASKMVSKKQIYPYEEFVEEKLTKYSNKRYVNGQPLGDPVTTTGYECTPPIQRDKTVTYKYTSKSVLYVSSVLFYGSDGSYLGNQGSSSTDTVHTDETIIFPENCTQFVINSYSTPIKLKTDSIQVASKQYVDENVSDIKGSQRDLFTKASKTIIDVDKRNHIPVDTTVLVNKRVNINGTTGNIIDADGYVVTDFIDIDTSKVYFVEGIASIYVPLVVYYDSSNNVVWKDFESSVAIDLTGITDIFYAKSLGATKFRVQSYTGTTTPSEAQKEIIFLDETVLLSKTDAQGLESRVYINIGTCHANHRYAYSLNQEPSLIEANGYHCSDYIIVDPNKIYYVSGVMAAQYVPGVIICDKDKNSIGNAFPYDESKGQETITEGRFELPQNAKYILLQRADWDSHRTDETVAGLFSVFHYEKEVCTKETAMVTPSNYYNKNIWWCGTSIPAYGYWNPKNPGSYPVKVGRKIGATTFNEAVGSSRARALSPVTTKSFELVTRAMGNSVAQMLDIFNDLWTVDDVNKIVADGPRTYGITGVPSVSYDTACRYRYYFLCNSYQIKLISKYLISDSAANISYLQGLLGVTLYNQMVNVEHRDFSYQGDISLFVFDHGHNDEPTSIIPVEDIDSTDINTFVGAINTYIRLIYQYKPHARIVIISDYDDFTSSMKTIECQEQIAERWHLPFINLRNLLPFNLEPKVETNGYWDEYAVWHDSGFTWSDDGSSYQTNLSLNSFLKGDDAVATVKANINPHQVNGVWYWDASPRYLYLYDGLHPYTIYATNLYVDVLSGWMRSI